MGSPPLQEGEDGDGGKLGYRPKPKVMSEPGPRPQEPTCGAGQRPELKELGATDLGLRPRTRAWALDVIWGMWRQGPDDHQLSLMARESPRGAASRGKWRLFLTHGPDKRKAWGVLASACLSWVQL